VVGVGTLFTIWSAGRAVWARSTFRQPRRILTSRAEHCDTPVESCAGESLKKRVDADPLVLGRNERCQITKFD
jgi:hypothetical protein